MKKLVAATVSLLVIAGTAGAQYKKKPAEQKVNVGQLQKVPKQTEFRRISREEAYKLYKANAATFIDVRSYQSFTTGHIKGALSIPGSQLISRFGEVTPGKLVITYCACENEESSGKAVLNLNAHGVKHAAALEGGYIEWRSAGHPVQAGPK
jgi:rhodanese-related sulfurtransferase